VNPALDHPANFAGRTPFSQNPEMGSGATPAQGFFEGGFSASLEKLGSKKRTADHLPDQQLPHVASSTDEYDPALPQGISRIEFGDDRFCVWNDGSIRGFHAARDGKALGPCRSTEGDRFRHCRSGCLRFHDSDSRKPRTVVDDHHLAIDRCRTA